MIRELRDKIKAEVRGDLTNTLELGLPLDRHMMNFYQRRRTSWFDLIVEQTSKGWSPK